MTTSKELSMSKNLIYMVAIDHNTSTYRNYDYAQYAIKTWEYWCKKNEIDFLLIDEHNPRYKFPVWNKDTIFEKVGDTYDKIGYVDSDTMIHWNAPNMFDLYDDELCLIKDYTNLRWTYNSRNYYQRFYPDIKLDLYEYYSSAIKFFTKEHKPIFDGLIELYENNSEGLDETATMGGGKVQTVFNYEIQKQNIKVKELSPIWNMFPLTKKEMFKNNWQKISGGIDGRDSTPHYIKYSWIWHFTGFPIEDRTRLMKQTWDLVGYLYE